MHSDEIRPRNPILKPHFDALPVEIVIHIFLDIRNNCSTAFSKYVTDIGPLGDVTTLPLVSKQWNAIALGIPSLWNWVVLERCGNEHKAELIRRLDRSSPVLIDIYVPVPVGVKIEFAMDVLLPYLDRWGSIKFCEKPSGRFWARQTPSRQFFEWMLSLSLPHLHRLEGCKGMGNFTSTMVRAPQLKRLYVPRGAPPVLPTEGCGAALESFEISWNRPGHLAEILDVVARSAETLRHLLIGTDLAEYIGPEVPKLPLIFCPKLRDISMELEAWFALGSLELPVLESLTLTRLPEEVPSYPISSLPGLRSLYWPVTTSRGHPTVNALAALLLAAPNITSFHEIGRIGPWLPFLASEALLLVDAQGLPRYCPSLEHISLRTAPPETLQRMVALRPNLKSVSVKTLQDKHGFQVSEVEWRKSRDLVVTSIGTQVLFSIPTEYSWS